VEPFDPFSRRISRRDALIAGISAAGLLSFSGVLSACGSSASTTSSATTGGETTAAAPKTGGTLRYGMGDAQAKDSLDPALALTSVGLFGHSLIYDTLLSVDSNWQLSPMLAEEYDISDDAITHTFKLRSGVEFHNGKTLTSEDVAAHFKRILDEKTGSAGLSVLAPVVGPSSISTPDPTTIIFKLKTPDAFFGQRVAHYTLRVPQAGTSEWLDTSFGTGPFISKSFRPGEGFEFERNPNYWQEGVPYIDAVIGVGMPDAATRVQALLNGDIQLTDTVPTSALGQIDGADAAQLLDIKNPSPYTFDVDSSVAPYNDQRVQKAMKMLLDREAMLQLLASGRGVVSADTLIDPTDPWYPKDLQPFPYDPEQAKALLAEAGMADGFSEKVWTTTAYPLLNEGAAYGKQAMAVGGIEFDIQSVSADRYIEAFLNEPIVMDYYLRQHPMVMFQLYYLSSSTSNTTRLKDAQIDTWINELISTTDPAKQAEMGGEIIRRYNDKAAMLNPFSFASYWGGSGNLEGWTPNPISNVEIRTASLA
jgi:peptide/nickel transport system substrate-binding protein